MIRRSMNANLVNLLGEYVIFIVYELLLDKIRIATMRACSSCCGSCGSNQMERLSYTSSNFNYLDDGGLSVITTAIPRKVESGMVVCVQGNTSPECERFSIDFLCKSSRDIAFHFNPRLIERCCVRNSRLRGEWGAEERWSLSPFAFDADSQFKIYVVFTKNEFLVYAQHSFVCRFKYRIDLKYIETINVVGDVDDVTLDFDNIVQFPDPSWYNVAIPLLAIDEKFSSSHNPLTARIKKFIFGHQLDILGRIQLYPLSFYVNLQNGLQIWPHPNILMHVKFNFAQNGDHDLIRNAWNNGQLEREERSRLNECAAGRPFILTIRCDKDCYTIWIDGKKSASFKFRGSTELVDAVIIQGDVSITDVIHSDKFNEQYWA